MKILTITGTRPELIRLSAIIAKLDSYDLNHVLVYTNQNYDPNLSTVFFEQLNIRKPNYYFNIEAKSFVEFFSKSIVQFDEVLKKERPDKILTLGDTNSGLLSIIARKHKIPVYHMEAGNRCFDEKVPEELNRRIIDSVSTYNLPYTQSSKDILLSEGFKRTNVLKTGNPIFEVMNRYDEQISSSNILERLNLNEFAYVLVTAHRSESVDDPKTLHSIFDALNYLAKEIDVVFPIHPRTKNKVEEISNIEINDNLHLVDPMGFFDFVRLERSAQVIITDSGTVQEEACILSVPCIVIRDATERMEAIECGAGVLTGTDSNNIISAYNRIVSSNVAWLIPDDYMVANVSDVVLNIITGK